MPQNHRAPRAHIVEQLISVRIVEMLPAATLDNQRLSANGPECPHGAVHAANQHLLGAFKNLSRTLSLALQPGLRCSHVVSFRLALARLHPARDVLGVVSKNDFRSGALHTRENLQHHSLFIQPTHLRRGLHHGVLSADVVSAHRNIERIAHTPNHVQIRERRLDHNHVRALFEIKLHFLQRFPYIGRVHLVTAPVAKLRSGLSRFPERSVGGRTIFCRIRKDGNVLELVFIQRFANGPHSPIHHVRWSDDVRAGACESACWARIATVESFATSPFSTTPQWPWSVYSQRQTSVTTRSFNLALRIASMARCTTPSAPRELAPRGSLDSGKPKRIIPGIPRDSTSRHSSTI